MKNLAIRGSAREAGRDVRLEVVPRDNGQLHDGYVRIAVVLSGGGEVEYVGSVCPRKVLRMADAIRRRDKKAGWV